MSAPPEHARRDWVEIIATVVLTFAAITTAWSSYEATRWNGESTKASGTTNALRIRAARAQGLAEAQTQVDVATFIQWSNAAVTGNEELADFYTARFREEFKAPFNAWLATDPLTSPNAPPTPFAMDEYQLQSRADAEQLDDQSEASAALVRRNVQRAGNYVLAVVLFAVALFFAGMSGKMRGVGARRVLVVVGGALFLLTLIWIATFPVVLSV